MNDRSVADASTVYDKLWVQRYIIAVIYAYGTVDKYRAC